jgi:2-oxoglutarate dehydrogenase E2 component (dihydrolipoamide succinyltransferase)
MTEIRVPTLGESVTEATIGKWFKKPGDAVKQDEPLVELETDKVTLEVNAPAAGVLSEIVAKDGETVGVGALLGQIAAGAGAVAQAAGGAGAKSTKQAAADSAKIAGPAPIAPEKRRPKITAPPSRASPPRPASRRPPSPARARMGA